MKSANKITLIVSRVLVWLVIAAIVALAFTTPCITDFYIDHISRIDAAAALRTPTIVFVYIALVPAFIAAVALARLLGNISKDKVFIKQNVTLLRVIYLSCFADAAVFFGFGFFYILSFCLAFVALFIGVMLRVVMNLIAQAVDIKAENDYTI